MADAVQREQALAAKKEQASRWAQARMHVDAEIAQADERRDFHRQLERSLVKLDRREQRQAKDNPAYRELLTDLQALPGQLKEWWGSL